MIDDLRGVLETLSDPADLAVVLIFGTSGFLIDAGLNAVGFLDPGYVGMTAATGALGIKKAIELGFAKRRESRRETRRAVALMRLLQEKDQQALVAQLRSDLDLFETGVVDVDSFRTSLNELVATYRSRSRQVKSEPERSGSQDPLSAVSIARFHNLGEDFGVDEEP